MNSNCSSMENAEAEAGDPVRDIFYSGKGH